MSEKCVKSTYTLYTYQERWENIKKKHNLSDDELRQAIENALQMWACSDIMESVEQGIEFSKDIPPELKEIAEYRAKQSQELKEQSNSITG